MLNEYCGYGLKTLFGQTIVDNLIKMSSKTESPQCLVNKYMEKEEKIINAIMFLASVIARNEAREEMGKNPDTVQHNGGFEKQVDFIMDEVKRILKYETL